MSRATRFSVAMHALALIERFSEHRLTSEMIAKSVGTNASFVRRVLSMLGHAGLVQSASGVGPRLMRPAAKISLLDVYRAVDMQEDHCLAVHGQPNQRCFVGRHIQEALDRVIGPAEAAFEAQLKRRTLADVASFIAAQAE